MKLIESIRSFVSDNKAGLSLLVAAVVFATVAFGAQGCDADAFFRANVPPRVAVRLQVPPRVALRDAYVYLQEYVQQCENDITAFTDSIEQAEMWKGLVLGFINTEVLPLAGTALAATPFGAFLLPLLTGAAGLFMRRPGDAKKASRTEAEHAEKIRSLEASLLERLRKEKEASFNAGLDRSQPPA